MKLPRGTWKCSSSETVARDAGAMTLVLPPAWLWAESRPAEPLPGPAKSLFRLWPNPDQLTKLGGPGQPWAARAILGLPFWAINHP